MIIEKLSAFQFGRHEKFEFDCNGHVVGLLGPNGVGKSTILTLLEFLITGEVPDDQKLESYVKDLQGNGGGQLTFIKNGRRGTIFRQIGKTSKRSLEWDGRTITKAAEVDAVMAQIFGAAKSAVANAVFINQGRMQEILFNKDARKKEMFIKIVNLAYCRDRARVIDGKISQLKSTIEDLTSVIDNATETRRVAGDALITCREKLSRHTDWSESLDWLSQEIHWNSLLDNHATAHSRFCQEMAMHERTLSDRLKSLEIPSLEVALKNIQALKDRLSEKRSAHQYAVSVFNEFVHLANLKADIQLWLQKSNDAQASLDKANPDRLSVQELNDRIAQVQSTLQIKEKVSQLDAASERLVLQLTGVREKLSKLVKPFGDETWFKTTEAARSRAQAAASALEKYIQAQREIKNCVNTCLTDQTQCPKCGLKLADNQRLSEEELTALGHQFGEASHTAKALGQQLNEAYLKHSEYNADVKRLTDTSTELQAELDKNKAAVDELHRSNPSIHLVAGSTLVNDLDRLRQALSAAMFYPEEIQKARATAANKMQEQAKFTLAQKHASEADQFTKARIDQSTLDLQEDERVISGWLKLENELTSLKSIIDNTQRQAQEASNEFDKLNALIKSHPQPKQLEVVFETEMPGYSLEAIRAELEARQTLRAHDFGEFTAAERNYNEANTRLQELNQRVQADAAKRNLITDLIHLKEIISDDGLPMAWVNYQFEHMAKLTQEALTKLNADFSITIDRSDVLAFKFLRLDEERPVELPMSKLSGGQRVRLCIAFLMAIQKRLVPDVGLLVLDEPSTHGDEAAKEELANLFTSFGQELQNTESQLWIVDHAPQLERSFDKVKRLS